jgi:hypothetical protein
VVGPTLSSWAELPDVVRGQTRNIVAPIPSILARVGREIRRERLVLHFPGRPGSVVNILDASDLTGHEHVVLALDLGAPGGRSLAVHAASKPHVTLQIAAPRSAYDGRLFDLSWEESRLLSERIDSVAEVAEQHAISPLINSGRACASAPWSVST